MRPCRSFSLFGRGPARVTLAAAIVASLAACGSTPPTHVYSLMPPDLIARSAPAAVASTSAARPTSIILEPIRLPAQVDQAQWLVRLPDDSLALLEQERWASPLRDEFREALLEALIAGHGAVDARTLPTGTAAPLRIGVDVRRFDSLPGREARIEGSWTLTTADAKAPFVRCEWLIREPASGSMGALAAAHRRAVMRLGDSIGAALASAARGQAPACPSPDARS